MYDTACAALTEPQGPEEEIDLARTNLTCAATANFNDDRGAEALFLRAMNFEMKGPFSGTGWRNESGRGRTGSCSEDPIQQQHR